MFPIQNKEKIEFENQVLIKKVKDHQADILRIKKAYMDIIRKQTDKIKDQEKKLSLLDEMVSNKILQIDVIHDGIKQILNDKTLPKETRVELEKLLEFFEL